MAKVSWDEIGDELITDFCHERCPESKTDYTCPNHECPCWRMLVFCTNEDINDIHLARKRK